jgi:serine kinase of HPr protein (carbohydrate metabolism regulator)
VIANAGLIARRLRGRWAGVLLEGPSGSGKSDLALRALDHGFRLVADDRVLLWASGGRLYGRAPETLRGLIEVRGVGVTRLEPLPMAEVVLFATLGAPERMPEPSTQEILGVTKPRLVVAPFEESAAAKLSRAMETFDGRRNGRI